MCACIEDMPEVSEADCTEPDPESVHRDLEDRFTACPGNKLRRRFELLYPDEYMPSLVDECDNA